MAAANNRGFTPATTKVQDISEFQQVIAINSPRQGVNFTS
jgi:hypothetical protein